MTDRSDRPNCLIIMSDEHGPMFSSTYGHPLVETPNMDRLASEGVTFEAAYCNSPLCIPSRISFMTGQYVHKAAGWNNSTPLRLDAMTWPYLLRERGYDAVLSGKMHLIGPDGLHGFRAQLAVDLHAQSAHFVHRWLEGLLKADGPWPAVKEAGPGVTREIEVDDAVEAAALAYLRDPERRWRPWALCVGFIAPHFPFIVPEPYFSMYYPHRTDLPDTPPGHLEALPPAAQRLRQAFGLAGPYTEEEVRRARAAYYGLVTWMDAKIGRLLEALDQQGLAENTVVIYTSDHGELLGEHGLWRKMSFYEQAVRVPLQVRWPGRLPAGLRVREAVSLVDATATVLEAAGVSQEERRLFGMDGRSLLAPLEGREPWWDEAFAEYEAHGTDRVQAMLRAGRWKLCYGHGDPPELELYDLEADPGEFRNLAASPEHAPFRDRLLERLLAMWDPEAVTAAALAAQESHHIIRKHTRASPLF